MANVWELGEDEPLMVLINRFKMKDFKNLNIKHSDYGNDKFDLIPYDLTHDWLQWFIVALL